MKEVVKTVFCSSDGKEFDTREQCEAYETLRESLNAHATAIQTFCEANNDTDTNDSGKVYFCHSKTCPFKTPEDYCSLNTGPMFWSV